MEGSKDADCYRSLTPWRSMWNRWLPVLDRKEDHRGYGVKGLQRDRTACRDRQNPELLKYCLRQAQPRDPQVEDTPLNRIESARFSSECCPQPDQGGGITRRRNEEITGHKTEHVFERYNVNPSEDIRDALIKVGQFSDATVTMIAEKPSTR